MLRILFFFVPNYFFFLLLLYRINFFEKIAWNGIFLFVDSYVFLLLIIIILFIYGVVIIREKNINLLILSGLLIWICYFFFVSRNLLMLYIFFELSLFPILVIILGFGAQIEKINSGYYLLFYASLCSFPYLYVYYKSNILISLCYFDFFINWEMFFILTLSFIIKFPVYFLHLWLPKAHVEAPTTARILLAGLLLKLGTAGFLRIIRRINFIYNNFWVFIALMGIILASACCVFQSDSKSLAAYSSVTHIRFLLLSLTLIIIRGKVASLIIILAHGYTSTLIFYVIGEFYHISSRRIIYFINNFITSSMLVRILFSLIFLSNSGVPPSLSFLSEFIIIVNNFIISKMLFFFIFLYFIIAFYYSLFLIVSSFAGKYVLSFSNYNYSLSIFIIFMMYNIFWLRLFF